MSTVSDRLYTAAQVRQLDAAAIEGHGIPGYELMCRAGAAVVEAAVEAFPDARRWLVLCGGGNNGGDGYVVARLAAARGIEVQLAALKAPGELSGDAATAATDWLQDDGAIMAWGGELPEGADLVIDALLGTGLDREVEGAFREAIEAANTLDCPCVAVDIPSGLQADTGAVLGIAIRAELTVSFIGQKRGLYTLDGPDHAGRVIFDTLGTPGAIHAAAGESGTLLEADSIRRQLKPRLRNSHKGHFGHVLVVGGNVGMGGAARLAGEAALRAGAGLVTVATHPAHAHWVNAARPELMAVPVSDARELDAALERATVLAVGPGLGRDRWARRLLDRCLAAELPLVLDADGLNLLAERGLARDNWILTPHPAEAARLLDADTASVQADRVTAAQDLAGRFQAVAVLKGCGTVLAAPDGDWAICDAGNPGMATAGSGDVLTGVVAGLLAQVGDPWVAACLGATAHAAAGDLAASGGERGMLASDISYYLPCVLNG